MHGPANGKRWQERWARRTPPDLILCNSKFTAGSSATLFPNVRAETVYCPVAPGQGDRNTIRQATRAELQTDPDACVIIQVSRMEPGKGHALHLEALSRVKDLPGWVCWQVGGAQSPNEIRYLDELKWLASDLGIAERVRFLGPRSDVPSLLAAADVFCQPNTAPDAFGIVFVEALNAQLPVVTADLGGAREILDEACGLLVAPGDARTLSEVLRRLIQDSALRERLGAAGPDRARELCDPAARLNQFREALGSLV
jgi:glycosyltransferase involved in cell wall biosynthesis